MSTARPARAILFDLDDTLVIEEPGARDAFLATCELARTQHGLDPQALYDAVLGAARQLWYNGPHGEYVKRIGLSAWEGLWAEFTGEQPELAALRAWAPRYKHDAWAAGLAAFGIHDAAFADALAEGYRTERRARHVPFAETRTVLDALYGRYRMAIVSNGVPDIQYDKLNATHLTGYFDTVVISADVGIGKPDPTIFTAALTRLALAPADAIVVGNSLKRDIAGAQRARVRAVWVNRGEPSDTDDIRPDAEIADLNGVGELLA